LLSLPTALDLHDGTLVYTAMVTLPPSLTQVTEESDLAVQSHTPQDDDDVPIAENPQSSLQQQDSSPSSAPIPRRSTANAQRPRPMSLPPQTFGHSATSPVPSDRERTTNDDSPKRSHSKDPNSSSRSSRSSNRILGDYILSKTLGAGSMGKVKLAHHSITAETVSLVLLSWWLFCIHVLPFLSLLLKFYPASFQTLIIPTPLIPKPLQKLLQKTLQRKYGRYGKLHYLCSFTILTFVACER
jgi:hypothetical protein